MTLEEIKNVIKDVSLDHKDIESFDFGSDFDAGQIGNNLYPQVFLEIPYLLTYEENRRFKNINFGLHILIKTSPDSIEQDHRAISEAEVIGDALITRLQAVLANRLSFETITALSLREFTDDDLSGVRFEFITRTQRAFCNPNSYKDEFNCDNPNLEDCK